MTTVAQIISDAFRVSNLVAVETSPSPGAQAEALRHLNRIVKSTIGNEAGEAFTNIPIGSQDIERPAGYPWYETVPDENWFVPENMRLMVNISEPLNLYLHPDPDDGCRFAIIDVGRNLSNNPLTIYGNGRLIEGQESVFINTDSANKEWFYRGDTGNWVAYSPLVLTDSFPFPEEFDDFFIITLAMRLNPSYGKTIDGQAQEMLRRSRSQLRARYDQDIAAPSERGLTRMSRMVGDRRYWYDQNGFYNPTDLFNKGWPY